MSPAPFALIAMPNLPKGVPIQATVGNCRILKEIGSGGMAVVYKAIQEPLGRLVAVKALKSSVAIDQQFAKRFEREAHFMASLQHENIIHVHDLVKHGNTMAIVMEYVDGVDLYDLLEVSPVFPPEVAAIVTLQVAHALEYAHFRGIIHRDIKPANIMVAKNGEVKLMDFGIARDERLRDLTETGTGLGTPAYMSPEQILGDRLDSRSDHFSLGIVLYQMLTGRKPFMDDDSRSVMQRIRLDHPTPARKLNHDVPRALDRILDRCLQKSPDDRYASTQTLINELTEFLASRATAHHSARLVGYLEETAIVSDEEAKELLQHTHLQPKVVGRSRRQFLRSVLLTQTLLLLLMCGGFVYVALTQENPTRDFHASAFSTNLILGGDPQPSDKQLTGTLRVRVDPWAHVWVDGQRRFTTPSAQPLELTAGTHYLRFENPYYQEQEQKIQIKASEEQVLHIELKPNTPAPATGLP